MAKAVTKNRGADRGVKNAAPKPTTNGGAVAKSLLGKIKTFNIWREQFNPLVGLDMAKARRLLEFGQRGEFSDLQWTFKFVEERFPTLFALIERRTSPLLEKEYAIRVTPEEKLPPGATKEQADAQAKHLEACYQRIDNLKDAIEHLAMATFRGYAHLQKQDKDEDGEIDHFEILDQWNFVRKGLRGNWWWNPDAVQTAWNGLPKENELQRSGVVSYAGDDGAASLLREDFVIREVKRPVDPIALIAFIGWGGGKKDYRGFAEIYGIPGGVVIGPPNVSPDKETDYEAAGQNIAEGGSGYLPNGSDYKPNDSPRGTNPFKDFLRSEVEDVVLAGTGGLLTMLTESGSGTLAGEAHSQTFDKIARSEAAKISEVFQRDFDRQEIREAFGEDAPVLAFFELVSQDEDAEETLKFKREVFSGFLRDGTVADVLANQTDLKQLTRDCDLPVNDEYTDPYLPVQTQQGRLVSSELIRDEKGRVLGAQVEGGDQPAAVPGAPKPGSGLPVANGRLPITNRRIRNRSVALQSVFDQLMTNAEEAYGEAQQKVFQPLRVRLAECLKITNREEQVAALKKLQRDLPGMLKEINASAEQSRALQEAMNSALAIGAQQTGEQIQ